MEKNFLNFSENQKDEPIYRIISIYRLFQLFEKHQNFLVSPKKWDDPFEKKIAGLVDKWEETYETRSGFRDYFFGQCWTRTRESDALWRIYFPNKNSVRIKTTPRKLLNSLYFKTHDLINNQSCFIGKVDCFTTKKLKEHLENNLSKWMRDSTTKGRPQSFLFKRYAFKHENEVRLLFNSRLDTQKYDLDFFSYLVNPLELIDDIVFDPRIEYSEFKKSKIRLKELKFNKRIVKSILYDMPTFEI